MKKPKIKIASEAALQKKYGSAQASTLLVNDSEDLRIPSTVMAFNYQLGGGLPYGKVMEIYGEESSGKSLMAIDLAYCTQQLGGIVLWVDAEMAFTASWAEANDLNLDQIILYQETAVEHISDWIKDMGLLWRSKLTNNEPILLIVDSTAALDCLSNINSDQTEAKAEMGNRAKAIYRMFRTRNELLYDLGIGSVWINQLRAKVGAGMFQDPDTTPGGKALQYYASIRVGFYGGKQVKGKVNGYEDRVGRLCSIRVKKNKVAPPKPTIKGMPVYTNADYEKYPVGFDRYFGLEDILIKLGVVTKKSKNSPQFLYKDKPIAKGKDDFIKQLWEDEKLRSRLLRKAGINTISTTQRKINKLTRNLFPIEGIDE